MTERSEFAGLLDELFGYYERGGYSVASYAARPGRSVDEVRSRVLAATGFEATDDLVELYGYFDGTDPWQLGLAPGFSSAMSLDQACSQVAFGMEFLAGYGAPGEVVAVPFFPVFGWEGVIGEGNVMLDGPARGLLRMCDGYTSFHRVHIQAGFEDDAETLTLRGWVQGLVEGFEAGRIKRYTVEVSGQVFHNVAALDDTDETNSYPWR